MTTTIRPTITLEMSLNAVLAAYGMRKEHDEIKTETGEVFTSGTCHEVWAELAAAGLLDLETTQYVLEEWEDIDDDMRTAVRKALERMQH